MQREKQAIGGMDSTFGAQAGNYAAKPAVSGASAPTEPDLKRFWGDRILRAGGTGLGVGVGAAGLYYLARSLSQAARERAKRKEEEEPAKFAGIYDNITEGIGGMLPSKIIDLLRPLSPIIDQTSPGTYDPNIIRSSFGTGATLGAGALGLAGGTGLVSMLHKRKKQQNRQAEIDAAEKEYHDALLGRSAKNNLDGVYDTAVEKAAAEKVAWPQWLNDITDVAKRVPGAVGGAYVATGLGMGGLAAKLMYDRAKERAHAKAVEDAAKSKARIAGILPTYVDPDEIASLKQQAAQSQIG